MMVSVFVMTFLLTLAGALTVVFRPGSPARLWFLRVVCRRPPEPVASPVPRRLPNIDDIGGNDDESAIYVIDGEVYQTASACPPPNYEDALKMKRMQSGDVVRFFVGQGNDAVLFEFSMPKIKGDDDDDDGAALNKTDDEGVECLPPRYCGRRSSLSASLAGFCQEDVVEPPVTDAAGDYGFNG